MARISRRVVLAAAPLLPMAPYLTRWSFGQHGGSRKPQLYVGTYTHEMGPGNRGEGIYRAEWDADAGSLSPLTTAMKTDDPSFLTAPPGGAWIYAVNEREDLPQPDGSQGGAVSAFRRDPASGALTELNARPSGGSDPCHVAVDRADRAVFVADYTSGALASYRVTPKGLEGPVSLFAKQFAALGHGPNVDRQQGPHIHCATLSPDERYLLVSDLGTDHIWIFHVNLLTAELRETGKPWHAKPGSGPRHTRFHPNGRWVYSINEMASTVDMLRWDAKTGTLTSLSEVGLRDPSYTGQSTGAELAIDRRGRFLYASNRAEDVLVVFAIDPASGALTLVQRTGCGGKNPRDFVLDPSERWLVVANQDTQNVVVFARDPRTGKVKQTDRSYHVGAPVCVAFV